MTITYKVYYVDRAQQEHDLARYIANRELDPHRDEDREEIVTFIESTIGQREAEAWLHYAPALDDNGLAETGREED